MIKRTTYEFSSKVYEKPYAPYYIKYKGHIFCIKEFMHVNGTTQYDHVLLECISDPSITVSGYVHSDLLEIIE